VSKDSSHLRQTLAELHQQLREASGLAPEDLAELHAALDEIREALERSGSPPHASLRERVIAAVERFEGSHPRLVAAVNRVADQLSELGI
jgi:hypothetical protein